MKPIQITRSVSRKVSLEIITKSGERKNAFQTKDFSCAVTYEVENETELAEASKLAGEFCEKEVVKETNELKTKLLEQANG